MDIPWNGINLVITIINIGCIFWSILNINTTKKYIDNFKNREHYKTLENCLVYILEIEQLLIIIQNEKGIDNIDKFKEINIKQSTFWQELPSPYQRSYQDKWKNGKPEDGTSFNANSYLNEILNSSLIIIDDNFKNFQNSIATIRNDLKIEIENKKYTHLNG